MTHTSAPVSILNSQCCTFIRMFVVNGSLLLQSMDPRKYSWCRFTSSGWVVVDAGVGKAVGSAVDSGWRGRVGGLDLVNSQSSLLFLTTHYGKMSHLPAVVALSDLAHIAAHIYVRPCDAIDEVGIGQPAVNELSVSMSMSMKSHLFLECSLCARLNTQISFFMICFKAWDMLKL